MPEENAHAASVYRVASTKIKIPISAAPDAGAEPRAGVWLSVATLSLPAGMDVEDDLMLTLGQRAAQSMSLAGTARPIPKVDQG